MLEQLAILDFKGPNEDKNQFDHTSKWSISVEDKETGASVEIRTNAGYGVQSGGFWFFAAKFLICSIHQSSGTRLGRQNKQTL